MQWKKLVNVGLTCNRLFSSFLLFLPLKLLGYFLKETQKTSLQHTFEEKETFFLTLAVRTEKGFRRLKCFVFKVNNFKSNTVTQILTLALPSSSIQFVAFVNDWRKINVNLFNLAETLFSLGVHVKPNFKETLAAITKIITFIFHRLIQHTQAETNALL